MDYKRGHGYWAPTVRKRVLFNVMLFEKLNFNRKGEVSSILLWHISALKKVIHSRMNTTRVTKSKLYAKGSNLLWEY